MSTGKSTATAYEGAYGLACQQLAGKDPLVVAQLAGVPYDITTHSWQVRYLGEEYTVEHPSGKVKTGKVTATGRNGHGRPYGLGDVDLPSDPNDPNVPVVPRILILHYLLNALGTRPTGRLRAFRELPGGDIYVVPFTARTKNPLATVFGSRGEDLVRAGKALDGRLAQVGHYGITVDALPRVPVTLAVWEGDDEFPASANILFDSTAPDYLSTEDLVVLAGETVRACARLAAVQG